MHAAADRFVAFLGVAALLIVLPGPDTALTIRNTLMGGRRGGVLTAVGVVCGQVVWAGASAAGLATLVRSSPAAFTAVKLAGAAYLVLLGCQALVEAARVRARAEEGRPHRSPMRPAQALRQGAISNVTNPKMAVFLPSLLPQFAGAGGPTAWTFLVLGAVFCVMTLVWLSLYAAFVTRMDEALRRPAVRRALAAVTGVVLVALGLRLAGEHRA